MSDASKPISVVSAFSSPLDAAADRCLEAGEGLRVEQRLQRTDLALGEGFDDGREGGACAGRKADRLEARIGGADRRDSGAAVGSTVERMPPGALAASGGRWLGALLFGRGITLSLPDGASPMRGVAGCGGGGVGGEKGSRAGGRSLPVRLPSTARSRRIKKIATRPIRMMS